MRDWNFRVKIIRDKKKTKTNNIVGTSPGFKKTDGEKATRVMIHQCQNSTQSSTIPYDDTTIS